MGEEKINWFIRSPARNGWIAGWMTTLGMTAYYIEKSETIPMFPTVLAGASSYVGGALLTLLANRKLKPKGARSFKKLKKEILEKQAPECQFNGKQKVNYTLADYARLYFSSNPKYLEKIARQTKNPLIAVDAMILYGGKYNNFIEGIKLLRDSYDWLDGKRPDFSKLTTFSLFNHALAFSFARYFQPYGPEMYLMYAMYESITKPEHAYYWSELARAVSREKNKLVPEAYLIHALLATAQKRTDEEKAWEDVLEQCDVNSKREYLGESQNPVWTINSSDLLKSTIVLKGDSNRENLELELRGAKTLEKILENAEPPTPLFISNLPVEGNYIYVMRTAEGDTLYERLNSKNIVGISSVEEVLAQIHAKYPLDGLTRLDLEQKINKKTKDLKLDEDFSNDLILTTKPVRQAIIETGTWKAGKDAHPENWILSHTVHPIDTLFKEIQPTSLDLANLYNYGKHFTPEQKRQRIMNYISSFNKFDRTEKPLQIIFREYWNAEIQRAIDLTAAWMTPKRKTRHPHIIPLLERAQLSIQNLKHDDLTYYEKNEAEYTRLSKLIDKLKEHVTPYIS